MNVQKVKAALEAIKANARDDERAHGLEDALYFDVLEAIAKGECDDPQACADLAIQAQHIEFSRWCA